MGTPEKTHHSKPPQLTEATSQYIIDLQKLVTKSIEHTLSGAGVLPNQTLHIPDTNSSPAQEIPLAETIGSTLIQTELKAIFEKNPKTPEAEIVAQLTQAIQDGKFDIIPEEIFNLASALSSPEIVSIVLKNNKFFEEFLRRINETK